VVSVKPVASTSVAHRSILPAPMLEPLATSLLPPPTSADSDVVAAHQLPVGLVLAQARAIGAHMATAAGVTLSVVAPTAMAPLARGAAP
jgi:hypothetical protein